MKILLIEDNRSISKPLCYTLNSKGYEVILCENCEEALKQAAGNFGLMIIDVTLPDGKVYQSNLKLSGNDCILAASRAENLRNRPSYIYTGSVLFKLTFARCALTVLQGSSKLIARPLFIFSRTAIIPATALSLKKRDSLWFSSSIITSRKTFLSSIRTLEGYLNFL